MEFTFKLLPKELDIAHEAIKESNNTFNFVIPNLSMKQYHVSLINFYIISNKVKNIINVDPMQTQYNISNGIYTETFLDHFFNSIKESYTVKIEENSLKEFKQLSEDLSFSFLDQSIRSNTLSYLCKKIDDKNNFTDDDQKMEFLSQSIDKIDYETILNIPDEISDELIKNAKLENDDKFAQYLINNEILFKKYYRLINISNLSDEMNRIVLSEVMSKIDIENISREDQPFLYSIFQRCQRYKTIIQLLYVISKEYASIDLSFIEDFNNDPSNRKYFIHHIAINDVDFQKKLNENKNYLKQFDVVVMGGSSCANKIINSFVDFFISNSIGR